MPGKSVAGGGWNLPQKLRSVKRALNQIAIGFRRVIRKRAGHVAGFIRVDVENFDAAAAGIIEDPRVDAFNLAARHRPEINFRGFLVVDDAPLRVAFLRDIVEHGESVFDRIFCRFLFQIL